MSNNVCRKKGEQTTAFGNWSINNSLYKVKMGQAMVSDDIYKICKVRKQMKEKEKKSYIKLLFIILAFGQLYIYDLTFCCPNYV